LVDGSEATTPPPSAGACEAEPEFGTSAGGTALMTLPFLSTVMVPKEVAGLPVTSVPGSPLPESMMRSPTWSPVSLCPPGGTVWLADCPGTEGLAPAVAGRGRRGRGGCLGHAAAAGGGVGLLLRSSTATLLDLLEAELVVFLSLAQLFLQLQDLEVQFFNLAIHLADLVLQAD
jgi:hypothetical protein